VGFVAHAPQQLELLVAVPVVLPARSDDGLLALRERDRRRRALDRTDRDRAAP